MKNKRRLDHLHGLPLVGHHNGVPIHVEVDGSRRFVADAMNKLGQPVTAPSFAQITRRLEALRITREHTTKLVGKFVIYLDHHGENVTGGVVTGKTRTRWATRGHYSLFKSEIELKGGGWVDETRCFPSDRETLNKLLALARKVARVERTHEAAAERYRREVILVRKRLGDA